MKNRVDPPMLRPGERTVVRRRRRSGAAAVLPPPAPTPNVLTPTSFPRAVEMILSALEVAVSADRDQRIHRRRCYRVRAALRLHSDSEGAPPWILYTRDVNARGLGFITPHLLPLGYGGILQIASPGQQMLTLACTLLRCRTVSDGWYEGSLYFNRPCGDFAV